MSDSEEENEQVVPQKKQYRPYQPSEDYSKRVKGSGTPQDPWTYMDEFGIEYTWDDTTKLWKSKEDIDTLIQKQQSIYTAEQTPQTTENQTAETTDNAQPLEKTSTDLEKEEKKRKKKEQKKKKEAEKRNTSVYISGLPADIKDDELLTYFAKCGIPKKDPETAKPKFKIYRDDQGVCKGDALFTYFKPEAVKLAVDLLDESQIRPGVIIRVQKATFTQKADAKPAKKKKPSKKAKLYDQQKELNWEEDDNCHVVIKNMFDWKEATKEPNFYEELETDLLNECQKIGPVEKLKIFERHPLGIVIIIFEDHFDAQTCIKKMNGRYFAGRQLEADFYDGWTDYKSQEIPMTEQEEQKRIDEFGEWLEKEDD